MAMYLDVAIYRITYFSNIIKCLHRYFIYMIYKVTGLGYEIDLHTHTGIHLYNYCYFPS